MSSLVRNRSSGRQRLRQGYVGKNFQVESRQYVVEDVIAEGGFSVVLEVRCTSGNNEKLALKRVAVNNEHDLYLCRQEIAIMKALSDCPKSVTYVASQINRIGREVYEVLILMQLYGGQSVLKILRQYYTQNKSLSEELVLKIFSDVCIALSRLHHRTKQIVHRDLKIENVLQDFCENFVLCDYGSCMTEFMNPTEMGVPKCEEQIQRFTTLAYRAPEMIDLYSGQIIDTKSDIWALGCFLYKLCFFDTPFGEQTLAIMSATFSFPQSSPYSSSLHKLIRYILNPKPLERPNIFQVSHLSFQLMGKTSPIPNVFNSPIPTLPGTPTIVSKLLKGKASEGTDSKPKQNLSPVDSATNTSCSSPIITTTMKERPRPRPASSVGPPPSPIATRSSGSSSPYVRSKSSGGSGPSTTASQSKSDSSKSNLTESTDSVFLRPPQTNFRPGVSQPLPPPVATTDVFGHVPFSDHDLFGSTPFNSAVKQAT